MVGKRSQKLYVGRIMQIDHDDNEVKTIFMRRIPSKQDFIFIFPEKEQIWEHDVDDIIMKLPVPIPVGGTARSSKQFKFRHGLLRKFGADIGLE